MPSRVNGAQSLPWPRDDERPGPPCYCGRSGCIETFLAGPSLARDHRLHTGETRDAGDIAQRAEAGDAAAVASMIRYEDRMARSLASVINLLDPDVIVLGGGLSNIARLYREVRCAWVSTSSLTPSARPFSRPATAIRVACAGPRGCGPCKSDRPCATPRYG